MKVDVSEAYENKFIAEWFDRQEFWEWMMLGGHERNFPIKKNTLDAWEVDVLGEHNINKPIESMVLNPTYHMYEAVNLYKYIPDSMVTIKKLGTD